MKTAVLILGGLLLAGSGRAQQLRGGFVTAKSERGYSYEAFYFSAHRFRYHFEGCLGSRNGEGTFTLTGNRLVLAFRQAAADTVRRVRPFSVAATSPPTFRVRVTEGTLGAMPGATVISQQNQQVGANTDMAGIATLQYQPAPGDELLVKEVGFDPVYIALPPAGSKGFLVRVGPPYFFTAGDTLTFQVQPSKTSEILLLKPLIDAEDLASPTYMHYERVSEETVRKELARPDY